MALHLKLRPQNLIPVRRLSSSSSNLPPPPPPPPPEAADPPAAAAAAESPTLVSSLFGDIKNRLKNPSPPRKIPENPQPPPSFLRSARSPLNIEDIRKNLAEFRRGSPTPSPHPSTSTLSLEDIYRKSQLRDSAAGANASRDFDAVRRSLRFKPAAPAAGAGAKAGAGAGIGTEHLPHSIFGRELSNKDKKAEGAARTEFLKKYDYDDLGQKLRSLRPEAAKKGGGDWFSLAELNERLAKLREAEDKETESTMNNAFLYKDLRESLVKLKQADDNKNSSVQRMAILTTLGGVTTPAFMLKPPQEELLEKYFHPDHMSSAEKMKLELRRVRDEFKMSESDCGSARVQVAQLTTKIKHLSPLLHKKDKHSRKGLQEMVQKRKKLLKYLRRTDWDSYCLVLSKLGLRDVPEYKIPDYKNKNLVQTKKSKGKRKKKSTGKRRGQPVAA